jgi:hypothetical protein
MARGQRLTKVQLADFSRQLKTLIDKAQRLRDEINRSIIAVTPAPPPDGAARRAQSRARQRQ